jgi:hypothetical protein
MPPHPSCSIDGCNRPRRTRGWCRRHYQRWLHHGAPLMTLRPELEQSLADRFWSKVDRSGGPGACWPWMASRNPSGYGRIRFDGQVVLAHRLAYELDRGHPPPPGYYALHSCDNPPCVNARHLFIGTHLDNMADMMAKGRGPRGERHGNSKLTEAQVHEIRRRCAGGETQEAVARSFRVHQTSVSQVVRGKTWTEPA